MNPDLLRMLCCPETHQPLKPADVMLIEKLNQKIASGQLENRAGVKVHAKINSGLVRADNKILFPIRGELPILLMDEAIPLSVV